LGVTIFYWLQYTGVSYTTATNVSLLVTLSPIWTTLFSRRVLGERLARKQLVGIAGAFIGALLVVSRGRLDLATSRNDAIGALFILANTLAWAGYTVLGKRAIETRPAFFVTAWASLLGLAMMVPPLVWTGGLRSGFHLTPGTWVAVIYLGIVCTAVGYSLWYYALQSVTASVASTSVYLEPLVTAILAMAILGERLHTFTVIGGVAIVAGIWTVNSPPARGRAGIELGRGSAGRA
ncbi:MAG TPA: EamA family transporter, partial [Bacillota bacterium]